MPFWSSRDTGSSQSETTEQSTHNGTETDMAGLLGNEAMQKLVTSGMGQSLQDVVLSGDVVQRGDKGLVVEELQQALGFLQADGDFGPMTEGAVNRFQEAFQLPVTGVMDAATLLSLADCHASGSQTSLLFLHQSSGASAATASQDRLSRGADASMAMADADEQRLAPYVDVFREVAVEYNLPAPVLMAIASRESRGGSMLDEAGYSIYDGAGFGLMQVDRRHHSPAGGPTSREHIEQAAEILASFRGAILRKHPDWSPSEQLRGAICAYNTGSGGIQTVGGMDRGTTGKDYSGDVWIRAQRYARLFGDPLT